MGSFSMHIAISKKLKEKFSFGDDFILGTVLPDLYKILLKNREITHFEEENSREWIPNVEKFCEEYKDKQTEIAYGYLAHLVQDKIWFKDYHNKMFVEELEDGKYYRYKKDNTIHEEKEYLKNIYTDYTIINKYLVKKYSLNREEINEEIKRCIINSENIIEKKELIDLIDTTIIDYSLIYDENGVKTFFGEEIMDEYYEKTLKETEKILKKFIKK